jgi:hypothetical protein
MVDLDTHFCLNATYSGLYTAHENLVTIVRIAHYTSANTGAVGVLEVISYLSVAYFIEVRVFLFLLRPMHTIIM